MKLKLPKQFNKKPSFKTVIVVVFALVCSLSAIYYGLLLNNRLSLSHKIQTDLETKNEQLMSEIITLKARIAELENEDTRKTNTALNDRLKVMDDAYKKSVSVYESLNDLKQISKNTTALDTLYAKSIGILSTSDYASASAQLVDLQKQIDAEKQKVTAATALAVSAPVNNTAPGSGYSRQAVQSDVGTFTVSMVAADMGSTKIIVDTASDGDCGNNCPVLPLATYVSRNGAYAGVNGSYFCPASYPTCAGKTNTFDLLVMNKNKTYFNSGNNVYSNNPVVVFQSGSMRFIGSGSGWGRDTGVDGVLMNYPLLVSGGNVSFGGDDDPKKGSKGNRSFVSNRGNIGYIGVVHSATVAEAAHVLKTLGMENALNLDDGGSTALWSGGYKVGPGRDLPNVILFVRK